MMDPDNPHWFPDGSDPPAQGDVALMREALQAIADAGPMTVDDWRCWVARAVLAGRPMLVINADEEKP